YPIVGTPVAFMYLDAPRELRLALYEFFRWVLTEGQKAENIVEGFIPIPEALRVKALQYLEALISAQ
ncbi:MAG: hypothetical protein RMH84_07025, partial [Sulfolobales archaeon]|nr:hypothetical protein [Sulfolobales archaeon]